MNADKPPDRIVARLKAAQARAQKEKEAQTGEQLLREDFETLARNSAAAEFEKVEKLLENRGAVINAEKSQGLPELRFLKVNHRLEAGRFALILEPLGRLRDYLLTVHVGLHPNAAVFMTEVPELQTISTTYRAQIDDTGFYWLDLETGEKYTASQIVDDALDDLCNLLVTEF